MKPKLKDYKYLEHPELSKENPRMQRWFWGIIFGSIALYLALIVVIVNYSTFFDSPVFGYILTVLVGLPLVWWSLKRVWNNYINK